MNRLTSHVAVFVLGFVVCALTLLGLYGKPGGHGQLLTSSISPGGTPDIIRKGNDTVSKAAAKMERFVVNIDTVGRPVVSGGPDFQHFSDVFGLSRPQEVVPKGQASGVIISTDGYILTNNHVVADASKVSVTLWNKKQYLAKLIGRDSKTDLAVIKIDESGLPAAAFATQKPKVGDWVIAVGNSLGLGKTVTVGVVSAADRTNLNIEGTVLESAIQTDAAINRGNSGGALGDLNGDIVGINSAIASTSPGGGSIGIGFAIPSERARWVAKQIIDHGKVIRPWLGIKYSFIDEYAREALRQQGEVLPRKDGARVAEVLQGSPADRAGLAPRDFILKINGKDVKSSETISNVMNNIKVGEVIELTVWHAKTGQVGRIAVKTAEMPGNL